VDDYVHILVSEHRHDFSDSSVTTRLVANRANLDIVSVQLISLTFICLSVEGRNEHMHSELIHGVTNCDVFDNLSLSYLDLTVDQESVTTLDIMVI
jgi:hypothetical protein